jgi:hypothetical protein
VVEDALLCNVSSTILVIKLKTFFKTNTAKSSTNGSGEFIKELFESPKKFKGGLFGIEVALSGNFGNISEFESHIAQEGGTLKLNVDMTLKLEILTLKPKTGVLCNTCSQRIKMAKIAFVINL